MCLMMDPNRQANDTVSILLPWNSIESSAGKMMPMMKVRERRRRSAQAEQNLTNVKKMWSIIQSAIRVPASSCWLLQNWISKRQSGNQIWNLIQWFAMVLYLLLHKPHLLQHRIPLRPAWHMRRRPPARRQRRRRANGQQRRVWVEGCAFLLVIVMHHLTRLIKFKPFQNHLTRGSQEKVAVPYPMQMRPMRGPRTVDLPPLCTETTGHQLLLLLILLYLQQRHPHPSHPSWGPPGSLRRHQQKHQRLHQFRSESDNADDKSLTQMGETWSFILIQSGKWGRRSDYAFTTSNEVERSWREGNRTALEFEIILKNLQSIR